MAIRRIHSKGPWRHDEANGFLAAVISPGMLVERLSDDTVQPHSTEGGDGAIIVAMEDALQGKTVADAYTASTSTVKTPIMLGLPVQGSEMNMLIKAGETITIGMDLISAGDGSLIDEASMSSGGTVAKVIGKAAQALDLSASGAVDTLAAVAIL